MGKTLKVCLAMGGGVSLGSFSGSGLTEALKLLLLFGKDEKDEPYDNVIVDGMSGASAGAIALTIMLKCLIDYKSMMPLLDKDQKEEDLLNEISKNYFDGDKEKARGHKHYNSIKALQVAQKIQYRIWVEEVDSLKLYGRKVKKEYNLNINESFALLDRGLLEELTKKYLMHDRDVNLDNRHVLDKNRVIFACSLTNLLPIEVNAGSGGPTKLEQNVLKSTGSQNHSELRIIDFVFDQEGIGKNKNTDDRWLKFCQDPEEEKNTHFNIKGNESWATISASALACGAFPIAFEPVLLKRYIEEFGGDGKHSLWPKSFNEILDKMEAGKRSNSADFKWNSFTAEKDFPVLDYKSFNFPYIDGGTFNNEPIKEAFRIGTFQDFDRDTSQEERLILFVDPIVRAEQFHSFRIPSYSAIKHNSEGDFAFNTELSKMFGGISGVIGVLANQGSVKEEHKIQDVKENFQLRETICKYLESSTDIGKNLTIPLLSTAFSKIKKNLQGEVLSLGTRDPITYFLSELKKNNSGTNRIPDVENRISYEELFRVKKKIDDFEINYEDSIEKVYDILSIQADTKTQNLFALTVYKMVVDFALNTAGKNERSKRVAILPINSKLNTIQLPGGEISAFGGFASLQSRQYAFEYAKLSALQSLREHKEGFREKKAYIDDEQLDQIEETIKDQITKISFFSKSSRYSNELETNLFNPSLSRISAILLSNKFLRYIALKVPFVASSLLGVLAAPIAGIYSVWNSVFKKSPWKGSNFLERFSKESSESVNYQALENVTCSIISDKKINDRVLIRCSDSGIQKIKAVEHSYEDHGGVKKHQYLFNLYLLEYADLSTEDIKDPATSNLGFSKIDAKFVEHIKLSTSKRIKIPREIDGNLFFKEGRKAFQENFENIVEEMRIDKFNLPLLELSINDPNSSLHYSLKNINYHVNPVLEINLEDMKKGWYFLEKTESLDKKLLEKNQKF